MNTACFRLRHILPFVLGLALSAGLMAPAPAALVVVPGINASTEGNQDNGFPFNIAHFSLSSQRYQQVYNASEFVSLGGPALITQIAFRPDATFGAVFSSTLPSIQIDLSTTSAAVDGLSTTFASNVGANDTVVFSGALSLSSAFTGPANGPKDFDIVINLTTPFLYDPAGGNLLMDVRNFGGGSTTQFDYTFSSADSVSRLYTTAANGVNLTTGASDSGGLVTRFTATSAIPEPGTALFGLALLGACGASRRRKPVTA